MWARTYSPRASLDARLTPSARALMSIADEKLTIPKIGKAESLNVASASAVILSELTKRS